MVRNNLREVIITILKAIGIKINHKLSNRFWQWHKACRNKSKEIMSSFTYEDFKQLKNLNKQYKAKQTFLKTKTQFDRDYIYQMCKEIKKQWTDTLNDNIDRADVQRHLKQETIE
jgi:hypothetical protein